MWLFPFILKHTDNYENNSQPYMSLKQYKLACAQESTVYISTSTIPLISNKDHAKRREIGRLWMDGGMA